MKKIIGFSQILIMFFSILVIGSYCYASPVDMAVSNVIFSGKIYLQQKTEVYIELSNNSDVDVKDCQVAVEADDGSKVNGLISLSKKFTTRVEIKWVPLRKGKINFKVTLTPPKGIELKNEKSGQMAKVVEVLAQGK